MKIKNFRQKLIATTLLSASLIMFLSLVTFSNKDNSFLYYSSQNISSSNFFGKIGSYFASIFFYLLGFSSYLIPISLIFLSIYIFNFKKINIYKEQTFSFLPLIISSSVLLNLNFNKSGGLLGIWVTKFLSIFFDNFLISFLSFVIFISAILITTQSSFVSITSNLISLFKISLAFLKRFNPLYIFIKDKFFQLYTLVKSFISWIHALLSNKIFNNGDPDYTYQEIESWINDLTLETKVKDVSVDSSNESVEIDSENKFSNYNLPDLEIFTAVKEGNVDKKIYEDLELRAKILENKLEKFGVFGKVKTIEYGPVVTLFEYAPNEDTKISKIIALEDDLALALEALSIRIIAPIPGKPFVGFEVANKDPRTVYFSNIIHSKDFKEFKGELPLILGQDSIGRNVIVDLLKMPHLLVAGSTGSGKSVALNTMLASLLCKHTPDQLKLILIDPKRLEFASYQDISHLLFPIITQPKKSAEVLKWLVDTMEKRYELMAKKGVKNINDYHALYDNEKVEMPFIVLVIDELADLMMTTGKEIEVLIARIAQMARAAGIHMIVATQRPSVDVITGLIKVNFPSRISFRVVSKIDSRTILDASGAEKLLGRGDMLFLNPNSSGIERVHGAYLSTKEINSLVNHIKLERDPEYIQLNMMGASLSTEDFEDQLFMDIVNFLKEIDEVSISFLQRKFRIGYNRSARIMEQLESLGYILPADGGKMRKVVKDLNGK